MMITTLAVALAFPWYTRTAIIPEPRATVCNGHAELCSRSYANVTYIGAHDSYAVDSDPIDLSANQNIDITAQLNLGVRLLQSQGHLSNGHVELCHTNQTYFEIRLYPWADDLGGSLLTYLITVRTWLDANPNEVLTLVVTNGDGLSVSQYWGPDFVSAGLDKYAYIPPSTAPDRNNWPTLGSMIDSGKRLVVFMDYSSDPATVPYILPEFSSVWETKYDVTDNTFPCTVDRGSTPNMLMINHFLDTSVLGVLLPSRSAASTTNSVSSIRANSNGCASLNGGFAPTFVLLDFVDKGEAIAAGNKLNGF